MNSYDNYITWFYNFDTAFNSLIFFPQRLHTYCILRSGSGSLSQLCTLKAETPTAMLSTMYNEQLLLC